MKLLLDAASEAHGRWIAYGGGAGLYAFSSVVSAQVNQAVEIVASPSQSSVLTVSAIVSLGGLAVVVGRFLFDVFKYFDQRKQRRDQEPE